VVANGKGKCTFGIVEGDRINYSNGKIFCVFEYLDSRFWGLDESVKCLKQFNNTGCPVSLESLGFKTCYSVTLMLNKRFSIKINCFGTAFFWSIICEYR